MSGHLVEEANKQGAADLMPFCPTDHGVHESIWPRLDVTSPTSGRRGHKWVFKGAPVWCVEGEMTK
jgi:hypothetical protein